ncbi:hypothetical protein HYV81_04070 [Candidatus Woesearchaeota archaeon]|nr:hypothetical protein [Candidatus Woesearchaeota archaeon]
MKQPQNTRSISRIEPLALAKVLSVIAGILYCLSGIIIVAVSRFYPLFQLPTNQAVFIVATTLYGIIGGFLVGLIGALLYNWLSRYIGTVKIEVE